ncbi:hypothetical protein [Zhihengliuella flava]|uniref:Uncharacterized protein n=1 Tax=Zhihengliuella flava TaxID=1285193 RepID=A0A931D786_9MICC|nr:hypothetical protein [Zhihengliuella flava]MBG6084970.1 hypothetical protein [Zhihengliuella flava]
MDTAGQNDAGAGQAPQPSAAHAAETSRFTSKLLWIYSVAFVPWVIVAIVLAGMAQQGGGDAALSGAALWLWFLAAAAPTAAAIGVLFIARSHPAPAVAQTALILAGVSLLLLVTALMFGAPKLTLLAMLAVWAAVLRTHWMTVAAGAMLVALAAPLLLAPLVGSGAVPAQTVPVIDAAMLGTLIACAVKARTTAAERRS